MINRLMWTLVGFTFLAVVLALVVGLSYVLTPIGFMIFVAVVGFSFILGLAAELINETLCR